MSFTPEKLSETLTFSLHNIAGQTLISNRVPNVNGSYEFEFDMSFAEPGVYLVRLGSTNFGKVKRVVVN